MNKIMSYFGLLVVLLMGLYGWNAYKFVNCDFEQPYKCEIIHGIGLVSPLYLATVWFDDDSSVKSTIK